MGDDTHPADLDPAGDPFLLGPYRVTGILGRGGMGVVYRGEHADTGEAVAIKTVRAVEREHLASIRREIHALGRVRHPGVVRILADGETDGLPWYAMPLLQGRTLRQHLRALWPKPAPEISGSADLSRTAPMDGLPGAPPQAVAAVAPPSAPGPALLALLTLIRRLCAPLAFLHGEGLVHRDLKPENVLLQDDDRPVLVDLGIAVHFGGAGGREELDVERLMGTPAYMAPEQLRGELIDARADLYALGCMLYECATGQPPFTGDSNAAIRIQHLDDRPLRPSDRAPGIPAELDDLILQLLEKRPQDRLGYAADVAAALAALGAEAEPERAPPPRAYLYRPGLVGRAGAMASLDEAVKRVAQRHQGGFVLIHGESGVGKTRIAMEVAQKAMQRSLTVVTGRCLTLGASMERVKADVAPPLHPFRPLLLEAADRAREGGRATAERLFGARVNRAKVLAAYEPALLALPGQKEQPALPQVPPEQARKRVITSLLETIGALSEVSPLVLVLDDIQWADELSLSVLDAFVNDSPPNRGVLIVGTYRSEETRSELEALARVPGVTTIPLRRLDAANVTQMIEDMLALRTAPRSVLGALVAHSSGNPFFVAEYLRAAIGEGMLRRDEEGSWRFDARGSTAAAAAAISSLPLPHTLAALIDRRLGRLDVGARALVAWGAVLGQELDDDLLLAHGGAATLEALDTIRRLQLLEEGPGGRLRFAHDKIREIAYERIPQAERCALHRRAAEALEARYADAPDMARTLGYHHARAGIHDKAGRWFARAANRAGEVYANAEAISLYRAAIDELTQAPGSAGPEDFARLHEQLGDVLRLVGDQMEARRDYEVALAAAPPAPHLDRARLHRKIGKTWELHHQHAEAFDLYAQAEAALGEAPGDPAEAWRDEWLLIQLDRISVHYWLAELQQLRERVDMIRPIVERSGTSVQRARFLHALTQLGIQLERYVASPETVRWARDCLAASEALDEAREGHWPLTARCSLAIILMLHGAFEEADRQMRESLNDALRTGDLEVRARCLTYLTVIERQLLHVGSAKKQAEWSLSVSKAARMREYTGAALGNLAWVALRRGDLAEAERHAREALDCWKTLSLVYPFQWLARLPLAAVELANDRMVAALEQVRAVLDVQQQRLPDKLATKLASASAAFAKGNAARARWLLSRALRTARRLGYA